MNKDPRTNFLLIRCCWNCHYFKHFHNNNTGCCKLSTVLDPKAKPLKSHGSCVCDAHTWKKNRHVVQKSALLAGAKLPDDAV